MEKIYHPMEWIVKVGGGGGGATDPHVLHCVLFINSLLI